MSDLQTRLEASVAKSEEAANSAEVDSGLLHDFVHGGQSESVNTESGTIRTLSYYAKMIANTDSATSLSGRPGEEYITVDDVKIDGTNVAVGTGAGYNNETGNNWTANGFQAGYSNTTGSSWTVNGYRAGYSNKTGSSWTVSGYQAGYNNETGNNWTANGFQAGYSNTTGSSWTVNGYRAGYSNKTGSSWTVSGYQAGYNNETGNNWTANGFRAGYYGNYSGFSALGYNAQVTADNQVQLGGAGTTPYAYAALQVRSDERDKTDIVSSKLGLDFIKELRPVEARWDLRDAYREPSEIVIADSEQDALEHLTNGYAQIADKYYKISDSALKEVFNIEQIDIISDGQEKVKDCTINFVKDCSRAGKRKHQMLIAQEVAAAAERRGVDFSGYQNHAIAGGEDVHSLSYETFIMPLINAVQELAESHEAIIMPLADAVKELSERIEKLEAANGRL